NELCNMNLNAQLAVLSACNTGSGSYKKGEGNMSLSRAFNYAGVPTTVHSLWKVPDEATSSIMLKFYEGLKNGLRKDEALKNAKSSYLENNVIPERAHPYYWAGFVLNGNESPILIEAKTSYTWLIILGMAMLSILAFWFKTKNS
ncbi:MAG: CHAT domain-containing protein, partial [Bacteroidota bacterium]